MNEDDARRERLARLQMRSDPLRLTRQHIEALAKQNPQLAGLAFSAYKMAVSGAFADQKSYSEIFTSDGKTRVVRARR